MFKGADQRDGGDLQIAGIDREDLTAWTLFFYAAQRETGFGDPKAQGGSEVLTGKAGLAVISSVVGLG